MAERYTPRSPTWYWVMSVTHFWFGFFRTEVSLQAVLCNTLSRCIRAAGASFTANLRLNTEHLHQAEHLFVVHPYPLILPKEQLELSITIFAFISLIRLKHLFLRLCIAIDSFTFYIGIKPTPGHAKHMAEFLELTVYRYLFHDLKSLLFASSFQATEHFFSN